MRCFFTILWMLMSVLNVSSQVKPVTDSTLWTFTVKFNSFSFNQACNLAIQDHEFKVVKTEHNLFDFPIKVLYILKNNTLPDSVIQNKTFLVKGYVTYKKDWVYGCFSSIWEETKMYIEPVYFARTFETTQY